MTSKTGYFMDAAEIDSDEEWIQQTLQGNTACFERIVTRYSAPLLRFIYGRVQSAQDAEDICQETFLKAFRSLRTFDLRSSFKTWLFAVAFHETVSFLRKKKVSTCSTLPEIADRRSQEESAFPEAKEIWTAAQCLPPDQYTLLWLKYKEDLSIRQIAQISGKSRMYTRVLLHRARKKLGEILGPSIDAETRGITHEHTTKVSCSIQGESNVL